MMAHDPVLADTRPVLVASVTREEQGAGASPVGFGLPQARLAPPRLMTITPIEVSIKRQLTADNLLMLAITSHICPVTAQVSK